MSVNFSSQFAQYPNQQVNLKKEVRNDGVLAGAGATAALAAGGFITRQVCKKNDAKIFAKLCDITMKNHDKEIVVNSVEKVFAEIVRLTCHKKEAIKHIAKVSAIGGVFIGLVAALKSATKKIPEQNGCNYYIR